MSELFPGFTERMVEGDGTRIHVRSGGSGPALLLVHGFPQTGAMWHRVAGKLAEHFSVIIPDLRGYGRSGKPVNDEENLAYSKRAMGNDLIAVMKAMGHDRFRLCGHDRGGRVAYRMALDHPAEVASLITLDIVPTIEQWRAINSPTELVNVYHWSFLAQPHPLPEQMIGANPDFYLDWTLASWTKNRDTSAFSQAALSDYHAAIRNPAVIHAMCCDYRAGATCDVMHDQAACEEDRKITCPMLALWGDAGIPDKSGAGPLAVWQEWATDVTGHSISCGHFLAEEAPDETLGSMLKFLKERVE